MRKLLLLAVVFAIAFSACKKDSKHKINKNHRQSVGHSAHDLLSDNKYKDLVVEIQYMSEYKPDDAAIDNLKTFLSQRLHKNVNVTYTEIGAQGKSVYTLDDIHSIEDANRKEFTAKKQIAVYFVFLDGGYSEDSDDSKVLGVAYYNTSMAVFKKSIDDLSGGFGQPSGIVVETTVINHEFGHILGLVNTGSPMQALHQDVSNGAHCSNQDCLMYWETESGDVVSNLFGMSSAPALDANCLADLQTNGGK